MKGYENNITLIAATSDMKLNLIDVTHCDTKESLQFDFTKITIEQRISLLIVISFVAIVALATFADIDGLKFFSATRNLEKLLASDARTQRLAAADVLKVVGSLIV